MKLFQLERFISYWGLTCLLLVTTNNWLIHFEDVSLQRFSCPLSLETNIRNSPIIWNLYFIRVIVNRVGRSVWSLLWYCLCTLLYFYIQTSLLYNLYFIINLYVKEEEKKWWNIVLRHPVCKVEVSLWTGSLTLRCEQGEFISCSKRFISSFSWGGINKITVIWLTL